MSSDSEDYDSVCGGPIVLTDKDCAEIDALSALYSLPATSNTSFSSNPTSPDENMPPSITITPAVLNGLKTLSPFKRFRPNGRLSVTDLVAPTWCEVQYEYGLQQQRSRKLEHRPSRFMTRNGKEIVVKKDTAVANDATLKAGHAVHSVLEREIHPDRVVIEAKTQEELWARKFCDILACLQSLTLCNICREFPVVGFVHGQLVAGIIDEIKRYPCSDTNVDHGTSDPPSPSSLSSRDSPSPSTSKRRRGRPRKTLEPQSSDSEGSVVIADPSKAHHRKKSHRLFLSDSKTRFSFSLPSHSASLASRLQLMLYRNLLNDLISVSVPFDFDKLWRSLAVDPSRRFSDSFLAQILPLLGDNSNVSCLKDIEREWKTALTGLDLLEKTEDVVLPVHEQLTIVYRLRAGAVATGKRRRPSYSIPPPESEQIQLQRALLESLQSYKPPTTDSPKSELPVDTQTLGDQDATPSIAAISEEIGSKTANLVGESGPADGEKSIRMNGSTEQPQPDATVGAIIGQVQFDHDETLLNSHIDNILNWWYGKREPQGVSLEDSNRCNACEYISGCEWREKMVTELLNK